MLFDDTPLEQKKKLTQGQSKIGTEDKQRGLSSAFKINLQIFKKTASRVSWKPVRYQHFDLNCGTGYNDEADCIGSPVAFVEMANTMGINNFNAYFCDRDEKSLKTLMQNEAVRRNECDFFWGDNRSLIPSIPNLIKHSSKNESLDKVMGTVLSDPNGADVPVDELAWLNKKCEKIDIVINWASRAYKLHRTSPNSSSRGTLKDCIDRIGKKYWLIGRPRGNFAFTLLIGRNFEVGDHKSLGLYRLDSDIGQMYFDQLNFTEKERQAAYPSRQAFFDFDGPECEPA
jgi:hypothetical protein